MFIYIYRYLYVYDLRTIQNDLWLVTKKTKSRFFQTWHWKKHYSNGGFSWENPSFTLAFHIQTIYTKPPCVVLFFPASHVWANQWVSHWANKHAVSHQRQRSHGSFWVVNEGWPSENMVPQNPVVYDEVSLQTLEMTIFTLCLFNIAMENGPFIDGLPIKNGDFPWLC